MFEYCCFHNKTKLSRTEKCDRSCFLGVPRGVEVPQGGIKNQHFRNLWRRVWDVENCRFQTAAIPYFTNRNSIFQNSQFQSSKISIPNLPKMALPISISNNANLANHGYRTQRIQAKCDKWLSHLINDLSRLVNAITSVSDLAWVYLYVKSVYHCFTGILDSVQVLFTHRL